MSASSAGRSGSVSAPAAAATLVVATALLAAFTSGGPAAKFEREWRHYVALRAADRAQPTPRENALDFARVIAVNRSEDPARFADELLARFDRLDAFARGETLLISGRLLHDPAIICASIPYYAQSLGEAPDDFARAIVHETLFAVGRECDAPRPGDLVQAIALWRTLGIEWRAAYEQRVLAGEPIDAAGAPAPPAAVSVAPARAEQVTFGARGVTLRPAMLIGGQADRVSRDWLNQRLAAPWAVDPEIDYFEGAVVNAVARSGVARTTPLYGAIVKKLGAHWYAPDEDGRFTFMVLTDKVEQYPTTRFLSDDVAVLVDAHGISALVALAVERQVDVVVGCCDYFDKIQAAVHLSERGIHVVCPSDRFLGYAVGHSGSGAILGGGTLHVRGEEGRLGGDPISMRMHEPIVVEDTGEPYPDQYYDTPARYFALLARHTRLAFDETIVDRRRGLERLLQTARQRSAGIVAVRVQTEDESRALERWLDEDPTRRALLFHSVPFAPGRRIVEEYPRRVTVPDASPLLGDGG